ncbi:MAG: hypothetical protein ACHQ1G_01195 [Planctomycetota bacterium]
MSARTEPRFTRDIDLAVAVPGDREAEALVQALRTRGYHSVAHLEQEATSRLAAVRLQAGGAAGTVTDLLFASSGIEPEIVAAAEPLEVLPDVRLPVARLSHLLALKVLSRELSTAGSRGRPDAARRGAARRTGRDAAGARAHRTARLRPRAQPLPRTQSHDRGGAGLTGPPIEPGS